jgi:ribonucleoside-diphosphate reductase alpha chain
MNIGPKLPISQEIGQEKHYPGETFLQAAVRWSKALSDDPAHEDALYEILADQRFLPAGRVQRAAGSSDAVTAFNCFVSGTIEDSMGGIMDAAKEAAITMQKGGGIGYNFGTIRPRGAPVVATGSMASGPLSFMEVFDAVCGTVASAGNRRGAQMGVMPVDHPDIRAFVHAKADNETLRRFNVSVGITDKFMDAVVNDDDFDLVWGGEVYETIRAVDLWNEIMEMTWDWAEPGVLFMDRINGDNNLWYCETIAATNPCAEQALPPYGACLLGSFNWVKYIRRDEDGGYPFDLHQLLADIPHIVRAMDNVIDRTLFPLPQQEREAYDKRRMGLGATGVANAMEAVGYAYGSQAGEDWVSTIMEQFTNACYMASVDLAREKGPFPLFDAEKYCMGEFITRLDPWVQDAIRRWGIRNSHLTSIAPTGSISLAADNVSSGIEPPFLLEFDRTVQEWDGQRVEKVSDYAYREWGIEGQTADKITPMQHIGMLTAVQKWIDSACSKTCNIGPEVSFEEFKDVYMQAWIGGAKGCTTFRSSGKRFGILNASATEEPEAPEMEAEEPAMVEGAACTFDPATGKRECE